MSSASGRRASDNGDRAASVGQRAFRWFSKLSGTQQVAVVVGTIGPACAAFGAVLAFVGTVSVGVFELVETAILVAVDVTIPPEGNAPAAYTVSVAECTNEPGSTAPSDTAPEARPHVEVCDPFTYRTEIDREKDVKSDLLMREFEITCETTDDAPGIRKTEYGLILVTRPKVGDHIDSLAWRVTYLVKKNPYDDPAHDQPLGIYNLDCSCSSANARVASADF